MHTMVTQHRAANPSAGGRLVSIDGRQLALRACSINASARGGVARVTLRQRFVNDYTEPLQVTYQVPMPHDGAVGRYSFTVGDQKIVGEIETRQVALERYEDAVLEGRTAALLEQDRSSVFTQSIGNIPPKTVVVCELVIDQKLRWLEDGQWEWRFPTVVAPRYMGAQRRVRDQDRIDVDVIEEGHPAKCSLQMIIRDEPISGRPTSPTHEIDNRHNGTHEFVAFADPDRAGLDRDVVIRWSVASITAGLTLDLERAERVSRLSDWSFGLMTITPPMDERRFGIIPRDVILLIDTSGSMSGEPLKQAKRVALELVCSLDEHDSLEMVEFSHKANRWKASPSPVTAGSKAAASDWIRSLRASGATEMQTGFLEALAPRRSDAQRQVILLTDGLVGFEEEIIETVREQAAGCRVHCIGIGSAANRSLTGPVARAGGGAEFLVGPTEDTQDVTRQVIRRISKPLITNLSVAGAALRACGQDLFPDLLAGCPCQIPLKLDPRGGQLTSRGESESGAWVQRIDIPKCKCGTGDGAIARLFAREQAEEIEMLMSGGERLHNELEAIGLEYQIATRRTSWVAISDEVMVDPGAPIRRVKIAQSLPQGVSASGAGLAEVAQRPRFVSKKASRQSESVLYSSLDISDSPDFEQAEMYELTDALGRCPSDKADVESSISRSRARLVSWRGSRAIIEIQIVSDTDWFPEQVTVAGGKERLMQEGTTTHGRLSIGQTIRLVLDGMTRRDLTGGQLYLTVIMKGEQSPMELACLVP